MTALVIARVTVLLVAGLLLYAAARRASASIRHAILVFALAAAVLAPIASRSLTPRYQFSVPEPISREIGGASRPMKDESPVAAPRAVHLVAARDVWAIGAVLVALRWILAWAAAFRLRRNAAADGRRRTVDGFDVIVSERVESPVVVGLFAPVILAPLEGLDRAALLHEAAHIRRLDMWTRVVAQIACTLFWFHPLAWVCARLAQLEQERACDDEVLTAGIPALDYADVLVQATGRTRASAVLAIGGTQMEARLRAIIDPLQRRARLRFRRVLAGAVMTFAALTVAASVSVIVPSAFDDPQGEELPDVTIDLTVNPASSADPLAIAKLRELAARPKTWRGDLVAQRSRWALHTIGRGDFSAVRESLNHSDWRVRAYAAWTIAVTRDAKVVPRLIELLDDPIWRMRGMSAFALAEIGDPRAEAAMSRAATDAAWQVRYEAARYLRTIGGPSAERLLNQLRNDQHIAVRGAAADDGA